MHGNPGPICRAAPTSCPAALATHISLHQLEQVPDAFLSLYGPAGEGGRDETGSGMCCGCRTRSACLMINNPCVLGVLAKRFHAAPGLDRDFIVLMSVHCNLCVTPRGCGVVTGQGVDVRGCHRAFLCGRPVTCVTPL